MASPLPRLLRRAARMARDASPARCGGWGGGRLRPLSGPGRKTPPSRSPPTPSAPQVPRHRDARASTTLQSTRRSMGRPCRPRVKSAGRRRRTCASGWPSAAPRSRPPPPEALATRRRPAGRVAPSEPSPAPGPAAAPSRRGTRADFFPIGGYNHPLRMCIIACAGACSFASEGKSDGDLYRRVCLRVG